MKGRAMLRFLITVILLAAAAWAGYWFVGSTGVQSGFATWFDQRRSEGWVADYTALDVQGFPNRFDTVVTGLTLADPDTGLAWDAPQFQINALSYRPNHVIAVWPETQRLATPLAKYDLQSRDMRASLVLEPNTSLTLQRTTLTAEELVIHPLDDSGDTSLNALRLAADHVPMQTLATYRLGLAADGLSPALSWRETVDPSGRLPETFDALNIDLTVEFDKPWDRTAIEDARPQPRRIDIRLAEARWGQLELQMAGEMSVDASGHTEGEVMIKARNWRDILDLAVNAGAMPQGMAGTVADGLGLISQMAGNPKTLDIPLTLRNGSVFLGPVPIGPAPVLRLR